MTSDPKDFESTEQLLRDEATGQLLMCRLCDTHPISTNHRCNPIRVCRLTLLDAAKDLREWANSQGWATRIEADWYANTSHGIGILEAARRLEDRAREMKDA